MKANYNPEKERIHSFTSIGLPSKELLVWILRRSAFNVHSFISSFVHSYYKYLLGTQEAIVCSKGLTIFF